MPDILIKNGFVATMDRDMHVYPNGEVYIDSDRIVDVGKKVDTPRSPEYVIDARNKVVMPGFVNTHTHLQQYFRGVYELMGDFFETNLPLEGYRREEQMETLGAASCGELIYGGCTSSMLIYTYPDGWARSVEEAGNRCIIAGDIEHVDLEKLKTGIFDYLPDKRGKAVKRAKDLYFNWQGKAEGRISIAMCPKAPDMATPDVYKDCKEFADEHNLRMTTPLSQSMREFRQVMKLYGKTPTQHLYDLGIMTDKLSGAHLTYTTEKDMQLVVKTGMSILHCHAIENPLMMWIDRGIPVGFGTDDYFHNMNDLLREIRQGQMSRARLINGADGMLNDSRQTARPTFYELLERATRGGAEAIGLDNDVGSIETGKKADIITLNMINPYLTPTREPLTSVFLYSNPSDVDNVICDGRFLKRDGKLTTIALEKALLQAQATCDEIIEKFFLEHPDQKRHWIKKVPYWID
jgi:5-methylthioadenosine/S-adenosylhomocysteine deaminase